MCCLGRSICATALIHLCRWDTCVIVGLSLYLVREKYIFELTYSKPNIRCGIHIARITNMYKLRHNRMFVNIMCLHVCKVLLNLLWWRYYMDKMSASLFMSGFRWILLKRTSVAEFVVSLDNPLNKQLDLLWRKTPWNSYKRSMVR